MPYPRLSLALLLAATTLSGCASWIPAAFKSDPAESQWVGNYKSDTEMGLTTHLHLADDHDATTTYTYTNGDPDLLETGHWQAINTTTVKVTMTTHQGRPLNSERIYSYDPHSEQLSTQQETVDGQTYELGVEGLILQRQ
ncbi:hypothetical protein [Photobacterium iliopiscarium]|jgi:hypothetical protein|uniref:Lipoprotein n=1 Tax=Photobacterium iliopiscarium TaxID=56192 RepID=A0A2T3MLV1_9GAMM|nr:hypothetical protein [Photobacterium iliopiscarium]KJG13985.1 hypothetical protein UB38_05345 [Photobacterium iliopiscarium]MCD9466088.1 hypothetical protein [Photobacterium iliopiscarium]MCD9485682.1 hypothetical protein [Photobacterium iliopiscarium]MCF2242379.1 hypothetical protein [Photobacterium iliopiscarium]PST94500.1 hypothetical protein C9I87_11135 [Photobacterium iliopiscarium]